MYQVVRRQRIDVQVRTVLDYRADVDLESSRGVTRIRWHISFTPKLPGTGWLWRW